MNILDLIFYHMLFYDFRPVISPGIETMNRIMPPSHLTLSNNQSLSLNPGKAPTVTTEASGYPNAPTGTCFAYFRVGLVK